VRWTYLIGFCVLAVLLLGARQGNPPVSELRSQCNRCHQEKTWTPLRETVDFDHDRTRFPLHGRHRGLGCGACHTGETWEQVHAFEQVPDECWNCHTDVHHSALGDDCARCHRQDAWSLINSREIHEQVGFPLVGRHLVLSCDACHLRAGSHAYDMVSDECVGCHRNEFERALANVPNHVTSTACEVCHYPTDWKRQGTYVHVAFPIRTGPHAMPCLDCHTRDDYSDYSCSITCHFNACSDFHEGEVHRAVGCPEPAQHECYQCHPKGGRAG